MIRADTLFFSISRHLIAQQRVSPTPGKNVVLLACVLKLLSSVGDPDRGSPLNPAKVVLEVIKLVATTALLGLSKRHPQTQKHTRALHASKWMHSSIEPRLSQMLRVCGIFC